MDKFDYKTIDWKVPIERSLLIDKRIDNSSLRLYLVLLSYARDKITAFPSRETLAEDVGCSVRNIDLIKNKLRKLELLDWTSLYNGSNKYNIYKLLQYKPIGKKIYNKDKEIKKKEDDNIKEKITLDTSIQNVIDIFKSSYKEFCENSDSDLMDMIQTGWVTNPDYYPSQGDIRNLKWYQDNYGDAGLKKLGISFKFLGRYLKDSIEYGDFHTNQGAELVPTISLFVKAKMQHDKIMKFTLDELRKMASDEAKESLQ